MRLVSNRKLAYRAILASPRQPSKPLTKVSGALFYNYKAAGLVTVVASYLPEITLEVQVVKLMVKVLFCALAALVMVSGAVAQGKAVLWDGNQWTQMTYDAKVGYVAGAGNLADFDASASKGKYGVITRAFSSELKAKSVGQIVEEVDKYYQEYPKKLNTTVLEVILLRCTTVCPPGMEGAKK